MTTLKAYGFHVQTSKGDDAAQLASSLETASDQWLLPLDSSPNPSQSKPWPTPVPKPPSAKSPLKTTITDYFSKQCNSLISTRREVTPVRVKQAIPICQMLPEIFMEFDDVYEDRADTSDLDETYTMIPVDMPVIRRRKWEGVQDNGRIKKSAVLVDDDIVNAFRKMATGDKQPHFDANHSTLHRNHPCQKKDMDCSQDLRCLVKTISPTESQVWIQDIMAEYME